MAKCIAVVQGHPDRQPTHLGHALANAYADSAHAAGHEVRRVDVALLDFPLLRTAEEWKSDVWPPGLRQAQDAIRWADHLVLFFPLWTGTMPAIFKAFLEQLTRSGFAFRMSADGKGMEPLLTGKSARLVVTMGMPAQVFQKSYHSYGVRGLQRGILGFWGIKPICSTYIGGVDQPGFNAEEW